ncbi:MAG: hypothetical protein ACI9XB_004780 [Gammaproteobacteria bacterium]|jgi:hypothetical protein
MIVVELKGGLGNQMFQYSLGKHLAIKNGCPLCLDCGFLLDRRVKNPSYTYRDFDLDIFQLASPLFASKEVSHKHGLLRPKYLRFLEYFHKAGSLNRVAEKQFAFDSSILEVPEKTYLTGYWQSASYFAEVESQIRSDLSFKEKISEQCSGLLAKIKENNSICLNVRRADYVGSSIHGTLGNDYYLRAEKRIIEEVGAGFKIYVFSDDIKWCRENIRLQSEVYFVGHEYAGRKFRDYLELMINCKHFIIPNSSFAWWAAWLCPYDEKKVISPLKWFHGKGVFYEKETIVPKGWIRC